MSTRPGAYTSLAITNAGFTITITRQNADHFDIVDNTTTGQGSKPTSWGAHSLDPFYDYNTATPTVSNGFIANFSSLASSFSMQFGDYALPDTDVLTLQAWSGLNGTGTLLSSTTVTQSVAFTGFDTATVSATGIRSVVWSSTTSDPFPNSLFYDNFVAVAVPEPGTYVMLLAGGLLTAAVVRQRRRLTVS